MLGRREFAKQTPDMLKYQPTRFWGMFRKNTGCTTDITAQ